MNGWRFIVLIYSVWQLALGSQMPAVCAQETASPQNATRTESLEKDQQEKARKLRPEEPSNAEQAFNKYLGENPMQKLVGGITGLRIRFGGLPSGSGFGLGPEYYRPDLAKGQILFRVAAIGSAKLWYLVDTELQFPNLARRFLSIGVRGHHIDANSVGYYGPGPDSLKGGRSNYRREESTFDFSLGFKPTRRYLSIGFTCGYSWINVGPGTETAFISTEKLFPPSSAPGIDKQASYLRTGPFLEIDSRDKPKDPHTGTHLLAKLNTFSDRRYDQYSFRQVEGAVEQYVPFFNQKRIIALRAKTVLSYPAAGQVVPFYMQPALGGTSDLRGYRRFRFYDDNLFLMNAEYRWEIFTLMDMALFADAGKVFHRDGDFDLKHLESDLGFGLRFKTRRAVVFRIDTAFSHEGLGLWITFDHVF